MEYLEGGNLLSKVIEMFQNDRSFSEDHAAMIVHQVLLALNYLHKQNIMHRDLKLDNLLCSSHDEFDFVTKLSDFFYATFIDSKDK